MRLKNGSLLVASLAAVEKLFSAFPIQAIIGWRLISLPGVYAEY